MTPLSSDSEPTLRLSKTKHTTDSPQRDRRLGFRVPLDIFITHFVEDKPFRALTANVSDSGIYLNALSGTPLPANRVVALEFELPGVDEVLWACGEVCYATDDNYFLGVGIRFTGIPELYARMIRDYCIEARRANLAALLARIRPN